MAESLVNPVSAAQLSPRNQEPTHLSGGEREELGDATDGKLDYAGSLTTDTSVPRSVPAEPTHLKTEDDEEEVDVVENDEDPEAVNEHDDVEVEFDGDKKNESVDDLDKAIDELATLPVTDIQVNEAEVNEAKDDDDEKKVDENDDDDEKEVNEAVWPAVDGEVNEAELNEAGMDPEGLRPTPGRKDKEHDDGGLDENDEKKDDEEEEELEESLKISIEMPKADLFESAGFNVKQQKKVTAIFESAIKNTTRQIGKQVHEHYSKVHEKRLAEHQQLMEERLNTYLDVVVEEWVETNRPAVRSSLRTELSENFLNGLQKLFTEHYIDVPESKTDVVKSLTQHVETLKRQVNEQYTEKLKLHRLAETANKKRIVATFARDMSESQAEKLEKLAEDTQYVNANDFREKLSMLKESYFEKQPSRATRLPEENVQEVTETGGVAKGEADMVADAITRQAKSSDW